MGQDKQGAYIFPNTYYYYYYYYKQATNVSPVTTKVS